MTFKYWRHLQTLFLVSILCIGKAYSQNNTVDFQTWTDVTINYNINNKLSTGGDFGIRGLVLQNDWNQVYIRPRVRYFLNRDIRFSVGGAYFLTASKVLDNVREIRLYQQAVFHWPNLEYIEINHRLRLEQRFFNYEESGTYGKIEDDFEFRTRYQLSVESPDIKLFNSNSYLYFLSKFEAFIRLNQSATEHAINNTRTIVGFGQRIGSSFKYELHYTFQKSRLLSEDGLSTTEHILRLRFMIELRGKNAK